MAVANSNGRALKPEVFEAKTELFKSDINEANYHSVTFRNLQPDTLYTYRVGDGVNWTEYYHFRTASDRARPFSFIYFGDAQNDVRTHWSRVFREAFRDAPRAAFTLHAGDLIDNNDWDSEWGDWHQGPDWVNGTIPVIATPGNHEYRRIDQGSRSERFWATKDGAVIEVNMTGIKAESGESGTTYKLSFVGPDGTSTYLEINDGGNIVVADDAVESITGFTKEQLLGSSFYAAPLMTGSASLEFLLSRPIGAPNLLFRFRMCQTRLLKRRFISLIIRVFALFLWTLIKPRNYRCHGLEGRWRIILIDGRS